MTMITWAARAASVRRHGAKPNPLPHPALPRLCRTVGRDAALGVLHAAVAKDWKQHRGAVKVRVGAGWHRVGRAAACLS